MTNTPADVVVIGAGPAGCAMAISAAGAGLATELVEGRTFPRHRPGETLHPGVQPLMAQRGCGAEFLDAGFLRFPGIHFEANGESRFDAFGSDENGPWLGFQAWRQDFDQLLLNRCRESGVRVRQPCRAVRPLLEDSRVIGVETSDGPLFAQFVVDAAGGRHWLARLLALSVGEYSPRLVARYGYSENPQTESALPRFIADETGWTWHSQVRNGLYHWTRLDVSNGRGSPTDATERGANVTWRCVQDPAGPGYFLIGDAAGVLDPASSHGVLRSLMSGIMAANVIQRIHSSPNHEECLVAGYCDWWSDWFRHDMNHLRKWYEKTGLSGVGQAATVPLREREE